MRIRKILTTVAALFGLLAAGLPVVAAPETAAAATVANLPARWESLSSPGTGVTCAIATNHSLWCWGIAEGPRGVAWDPTKGDPAAGTAVDPMRVGTASNWTKVIVGSRHSCAENKSNELWCWGSNSHGELGTGTTTPSAIPVIVKSFNKKWFDFGLVANRTCAISDTGLYCWGDDYALPQLQTVNSFVQISTSSQLEYGTVMGIRTGGKIWVLTYFWTTDWYELPAPINQTWKSFEVAQKDGSILPDNAYDPIQPRLFDYCAVSSGGSARCYAQSEFSLAKFADLGGYKDWTSLSTMNATPRQPICGLRSNSTILTCFSTYGISNYTNVSHDYPWCNYYRTVTFPYFTNGVAGKFGERNMCHWDIYTYAGTVPISASIDMDLPEGVSLASVDGAWFSGSVTGEATYFVWGRMFALSTDGRVYVIGDGKYGERQDGRSNTLVTESWASALSQPPSIASVNRTLIPKTGGASITLSGSFLVGVTSVNVGDSSVGDWTENADGTSLSFTSPTSSVGGTVDVVVNASGGTATLSNALTFGDSPGAPTITGLSPSDGAATINWSAPSSVGSSSITSYVVTLNPGAKTCTWTVGPLTCKISGLTNGTTYRATVRAFSSVGPGTASALSAAVVPYAAPGAPTITSVSEADGSVTVTWTAGAANGSPISRYDVEAQPGGNSCSTGGTGTSCTISPLTNGNPYTISVYATNEAGAGDIATAANTATPRKNAGSPTSVSIKPGDKQLTVSWKAPTANGGSAVTSYTALAMPGSITCAAVAPSTSCTLLGLSNGSVYSITVVATNPAGDSDPSAEVTASPLTIPGKPSISSVEAGANQATVRWRAPSVTGGASVTSYKVVATPGGQTCSTAGTVFACTVTGLENGVTYSFTVTATNSAGVGTPSSSTNGTPAAQPGAPRSVLTTPTDSGLRVTWAAPTYDGGSAVTGYVATVRSTGDTCSVSSTTFFCDFDGLVNGTSYIVDVVATNVAGSSDSTASNSVTPRTVPSAPTKVVLAPGAASIRVSWAAPVSSGGASITQYIATATPGSGISCTSTGTFCDLVGVTPAQSYSVTVVAVNAAGTGAPSVAQSAMPYTTPGAPRTVSAVAEDMQITVSWTAPQSDGGSGVTGYTIQLSPGGFTCTAPSTATSCVVTNLVNGTQYAVKVFAVNGAGDGAPGTLLNKVTPRGISLAPTILTADAADKSIVVKWRPLAGAELNGADVVKYTATASPSGKTCQVDGSTNGKANSTCTISGLVNGVQQTVTVTATNDAGTSEKSKGAVRIPRAAPGVATGIVAAPLNGSLSISWKAPADSGGVPITSYTVVATPKGGSGSSLTCSDQSGSSRNCVIGNLTNGAEYTVTVTAANEVGTGPTSAPVSAIPATVPSAPSKIWPTVGNAQISVRWTAAEGNGSPVTSYKVVLQPGNYGCEVTDLTFLGCTIDDLDNGVPYSVAVYAINDIGESPKGQIVGTATPRAVPSPVSSISVSAATGQATVAWVPGFNGGIAISTYLVTASPGGLQCTAPGSATQCVITNLVNGTQYTFSVTSINDAGSSQPKISGKVLIAGTPNAAVALKVKPGDGSLAITFAPPALDGGSAVTGYTVYVNDEVACTVAPSKALGCTVTDLENGTPQVVRVVANNAIGSSVSTNEVVATPGRAPSAVSAVVAQPGVSALTVSWVEPADDGGSPITGYAVTVTPGGKTCSVDADTTSCEIKGLTTGTSYTAKVVAINGVGSSTAVQSNAVKIVGAPTAVRNLSASAIVKGAKLYFAPPSNNGGSPITTYVITVTAANGTALPTIEVDATKVKGSYTVTGLTKGVTYSITVAAENQYGMSVEAKTTVKTK